MKKLLSVLTLGLTLMLGLNFLNIKAETSVLIEVYPYDSLECSLGTDACEFAKVGRNNWTVTYNGYRYWVVNDNTRYAHRFEDKNSDGYIQPGEFDLVGWNAFGVLFINNTEAPIKLKGNATRQDLTAEIHRIWAYFDENGVLSMLENHIHTTHMINDNHGVDGAEADWRLATALEIDAYNAAPADEKPVNMLDTHYRIKRVPTSEDSDGYIMEPLKYIQWYHKDYDAEVEGSVASYVVDHDPTEAHIPAGWKVLTFGTHDRGSYPPALNMVLSLPQTFLEETPQTMSATFKEVPPALNGFAGLDKNPYVDGVQVVADFGEPFVLNDTALSATWTDMYDAEGNIIAKKNEKIDFSLELAQDGVVLETINYTWDAVAGKYTKDGSITKVDTNVFEAQYDLTMKATTPEGKTAEVSGVVVVGVLPNRFEGHKTQYYRDGEYIDLMAGVKAYNGNGVDITKDVVVSWSEGFNPYNPQPGKYTITLDVAHEYHWGPVLTDDAQTGFKVTFSYLDATDTEVVRGTNVVRYPTRYNVPFNKEASAEFTYIDYDHKELVAQTNGLGWGSVAGVVNAEGYLKHTWNGFSSYIETKPDGSTVAHADPIAMQTSIRAYELQKGEYMILAHGGAEGSNIRYGHGDKVVFEGRPDIYYTAETQVTYELNVDDLTAPQARIVNPTNYTVDSTMFETIDDAILANVVAFDNYSKVDLFVDDDGGLDLSVPGQYTVVVDAEDLAGNKTSVTFKVNVVKPKLSEAEVAELLEDQRAALQNVIDAQKADLDTVIAAQKELIQAQQAALAALETSVETDAATKAELEAELAASEAKLKVLINEAKQAADANATDINRIDQKPDNAGAPIWMVILFTVLGAGVAFGASFLVLGRKK